MANIPQAPFTPEEIGRVKTVIEAVMMGLKVPLNGQKYYVHEDGMFGYDAPKAKLENGEFIVIGTIVLSQEWLLDDFIDAAMKVSAEDIIHLGANIALNKK